jgi:hypothetical protein
MASTDYQKLPLDDPKDEVLLEVKPVRRSNKRGCCCLKVCLIIFAVLFGIFMIPVACMYFHGRQLVRKVTVTTPKDLPVVDISQAKLDQVKDRAMLFVDTIRAGDVPEEDLVVTAEEINGFFGHSDFLRGNMYSSLDGGEIQTQFSLPTDFLPGGTGRYFVGKEVIDIDRQAHKVTYDLDVAASPESPLVLAVFKYAMDNNFDSGHLDVYLQSLKFSGEDKAERFIAKHYNLLEDFYNDPDNADVAQVAVQIESITIENNSIVVKPRRGDTTTLKVQNVAPELIQEKTMLRKPKTFP